MPPLTESSPNPQRFAGKSSKMLFPVVSEAPTGRHLNIETPTRSKGRALYPAIGKANVNSFKMAAAISKIPRPPPSPTTQPGAKARQRLVRSAARNAIAVSSTDVQAPNMESREKLSTTQPRGTRVLTPTSILARTTPSPSSQVGNKPLPSIPVLVVSSPSTPLELSRTLLDAQEQPLRVSPGTPDETDWPILTPLKTTALDLAQIRTGSPPNNATGATSSPSTSGGHDKILTRRIRARSISVARCYSNPDMSPGAAAVQKLAESHSVSSLTAPVRTPSLRDRISQGELIKDGRCKVTGFTDFTAKPLSQPAEKMSRAPLLKSKLSNLEPEHVSRPVSRVPAKLQGQLMRPSTPISRSSTDPISLKKEQHLAELRTLSQIHKASFAPHSASLQNVSSFASHPVDIPTGEQGFTRFKRLSKNFSDRGEYGPLLKILDEADAVIYGNNPGNEELDPQKTKLSNITTRNDTLHNARSRARQHSSLVREDPHSYSNNKVKKYTGSSSKDTAAANELRTSPESSKSSYVELSKEATTPTGTHIATLRTLEGKESPFGPGPEKESSLINRTLLRNTRSGSPHTSILLAMTKHNTTIESVPESDERSTNMVEPYDIGLENDRLRNSPNRTPSSIFRQSGYTWSDNAAARVSKPEVVSAVDRLNMINQQLNPKVIPGVDADLTRSASVSSCAADQTSCRKKRPTTASSQECNTPTRTLIHMGNVDQEISFYARKNTAQSLNHMPNKTAGPSLSSESLVCDVTDSVNKTPRNKKRARGEKESLGTYNTPVLAKKGNSVPKTVPKALSRNSKLRTRSTYTFRSFFPKREQTPVSTSPSGRTSMTKGTRTHKTSSVVVAQNDGFDERSETQNTVASDIEPIDSQLSRVEEELEGAKSLEWCGSGSQSPSIIKRLLSLTAQLIVAGNAQSEPGEKFRLLSLAEIAVQTVKRANETEKARLRAEEAAREIASLHESNLAAVQELGRLICVYGKKKATKTLKELFKTYY